MEPVTLADAIRQLPLVSLLVLVLIGGARGWWVFGWYAKETEARYKALLEASAKREEEWRQLALDGRGLAQSAVELARTKAGRS